MPLMMDDDVDMDMDDLFGDGNTLSLPARPPPKELFERVDELRRNGCCQGISWSRGGSIASISPDGFGIELRNLRCSPRDGIWNLAGPTPLAQIMPTLDGGPLQHVTWSPNGSDLAVIDSVGRITILNIAISLNRPNIHRSGAFDSADDIHGVAGAYWLNLMPMRQQTSYIYRRATKTDDGWRYDASHGVTMGPCHPNPQKSALICVTTNGLLRLLYPQSDGKWMEISQEIESIVSSDELITHASIGAEKSTLLVAFATTTKQLRVARVFIKWGSKPPDKPINANQVQVFPQLAIKHVAVTNWLDTANGQDASHFQSSLMALSSLVVLPPAPDGPSKQSDLPVIMTVRHLLPSATSHFNQDTQTIVDRWEVRDGVQSVHPAFEAISTRRNSTSTQPPRATFLKKMESLTVNKIALTVEPIGLDRILVFAFSDGSIEYRNRWSFTELYSEGGFDQFSHLSQIGFTPDDDEPCLQVALSPTSCSVVKLGTNGKMIWKGLKYSMGQITTQMDEAQRSAIVAGLAMALSTTILSSTNHDDLLAICQKNIAIRNFFFEWLIETCRILKFSVDFSEESHHDNLVRNPSIQLCFSVQNSCGYRGDGRARSFAGKLAWIGLQTRNCVVLFTMAANMKIPIDASQPQKISALEDAEAVRMLTGSIKWCLDLMSFIIDSLLNPKPKDLFKALLSEDVNVDFESFTNSLHSSSNIALHILLCSGTRGYLTAICRRLSHLDYTVRKAMATAASQSAVPNPNPSEHISNALRSSYTSVATLTSSAVVQIRIFEQFLIGLNTAVKESYSTAGLSSTPAPGQPPNMTNTSSETRNKIEQTMLFGGSLPSELRSAMVSIFKDLLPVLKSNIDPARLFFHDFSILSLRPDLSPQSDHWAGAALGPSHQQKDISSSSSITKAKRKSQPRLTRPLIDCFLRLPLGRFPHAVDEPPKGANGAVTSSAAASGSREKRYRRCTRCAAVMEDLNSRRAAVSFLIMQQRRCFCGGNWVVLRGEEVGA